MPDFTTSCNPPIVSQGLAHQMHFIFAEEDYFIHEDAAINTEAVYNACRVEKNRNHEKRKVKYIAYLICLHGERQIELRKKNNRLF